MHEEFTDDIAQLPAEENDIIFSFSEKSPRGAGQGRIRARKPSCLLLLLLYTQQSSATRIHSC